MNTNRDDQQLLDAAMAKLYEALADKPIALTYAVRELFNEAWNRRTPPPSGDGLKWRDINELPDSDDLYWFLRYDSVGAYTEEGPRQPKRCGYDADEWQWFAPCESPPYARQALLQSAQVGSALEELSESDKDIALGQAVEFAEYVVGAAKGAMVERAQAFLSLPYSQEIASRLAQPQREGVAVAYRWLFQDGTKSQWHDLSVNMNDEFKARMEREYQAGIEYAYTQQPASAAVGDK